MQNLKVTLIQTELDWEDIPANLRRFDRILAAIKTETHLIILPEMFTTGFSMNAENLAEDMQGSGVQWMLARAQEMRIDLVGSLIIAEHKRYYNRLCWAKPDGTLRIYDKRHLFRMAGEHHVYGAGEKTLTMQLRGWNIRPFICYDLRFPAWTRNSGNEYDLALFIANWPARRAAHWKILLQARAIENLSYVVGVNRIGTDGNGLYYSGDSSVVDPAGALIYRNAHTFGAYTTTLDYDLLQKYRNEFPAWKDMDAIDVR
jgi:predicted amidohydrolase